MCKVNFEEGNSFAITFEKADISARAILYHNKEVELLPDSELRFCDNRSPRFETLLNELLEDGSIILVEDSYKTVKSINLTSISAASDFVYGGSNNGWTQWKDEEGNLLDLNVRKILE